MSSSLQLTVPEHPLLQLGVFVARLPGPLEGLETPPWLRAGLELEFDATPLPPPDDATRKAVRDLLRHGGFRPSGRSKPASEFLLGAARKRELGSINLAVDLCNVVSLHSGLPISVVDLELIATPLRVEIAGPQTSYVFNPSGQEMRLDGLVCLHDAAGPCANPVKDSQRSKTHANTRTTLCVVWGCMALASRVSATLEWYRQLHAQLGAETSPVSSAGQ
ncbi:phenylalanine--tRNA ligase beta subunit-related protein [Enhygromyxa salina]|uniref:B3/4 domain protein n=1 Tax=Enhygromyxa salina TaxID=215803 RepID=A0A2S9Y7X9_9BACT|nr:phenylalanine--tRNA ligase beta subunit-related protein [Enhygromyxa salina]PRQ01162.1 B3/4 domain protein [Enhygromyxa salina]